MMPDDPSQLTTFQMPLTILALALGVAFAYAFYRLFTRIDEWRRRRYVDRILARGFTPTREYDALLGERLRTLNIGDEKLEGEPKFSFSGLINGRQITLFHHQEVFFDRSRSLKSFLGVAVAAPATIPEFLMRPTFLFDFNMNKAPGEDINLSFYPNFSRLFHLSGVAPSQVQQLLSPEICRELELIKRIFVLVEKGTLIILVPVTLRPSTFDKALATLTRVLELFATALRL